MALKKCYECGKEISTQAKACPHCGAPQDKEGEREKLKELLSKGTPHRGLSSSVRESAKERKAEQAKQSKATLGCLAIIVVAIMIAFYVYMSGNNGETPSERPISGTDRVSPPKTPKESSGYIDIKAAVSFDGTQFTIANKDSFDWQNVKFDVNYGLIKEGYVLKASLIKAGQVYTVGAMQFAKGDGTRLNPFAIKIQKMSIFCDTPKEKGFWCGSWE